MFSPVSLSIDSLLFWGFVSVLEVPRILVEGKIARILKDEEE